MSPNVVARPISCGLSSGSRIPSDPGMPLLARAPGDAAKQTTKQTPTKTTTKPKTRFTGEARIDSCHYAALVPRADAQNRVRHLRAGQRPPGDPSHGSIEPTRGRRSLVPRRLEGRGAGADRIRPPVRAPDVHGI